jgi:hypothetical protein
MSYTVVQCPKDIRIRTIIGDTVNRVTGDVLPMTFKDT